MIAQAESESNRPTVSFGIPVRNAEAYLARALDSILSQDLEDLEVVISDNASTDGTPELCRSYADKDPRVHYHRLDQNAGQIANFNRVLSLSSGRYFRWIGADDWLEADYAQRCVAAMDADPRAVLVTTRQDFVHDEGHVESAQTPAAGPQASDPVNRLGEMLRLLNQSHLVIDPIYSMARLDSLRSTGVLRHELFADQILAIELSLLGPFQHVPSVLAHRRQAPRFLRPREAATRYGVSRARMQTRTLRLCAHAAGFVRGADLTAVDQARALTLITKFYLRRHALIARRRARRVSELLRVRFDRLMRSGPEVHLHEESSG